uniref:RNase III domain-containing protein n=1 Tax=Kwoniella pini CBS 10737 TaxID=1296096 RepID=A0A1B9IED1_9TREE|nr:uncharacterized protein I206_01164 [Kwoniella pini CBS 10737]OCF53857.1 hypothetical protein I206_01164 [Kwoniella pini CBS 10737]
MDKLIDDKRDLPPHINLNQLTPNSIKKLKEKSIISKSPKKRKVQNLENDITSTHNTELNIPTRKKRKNDQNQDQLIEKISTNQPSFMLSSPINLNTFDAEEIYTTRNGTILSFSNAGNFLTHWYQAIGQQNLNYEERNVLPNQLELNKDTSNTSKRNRTKESESNSNNPQNTLRECIITLPNIGQVHSAKLPEGGWSNKKLAKKSASFESVKLLYQLGRLDDNLKYIPKSSATTKNPATLSGINLRETEEPDEEKIEWEKQIRLSSKSKVMLQYEEQKKAIKSKLPSSPSLSLETITGEYGKGNYSTYILPPFWSRCSPLQSNNLYAITMDLSVNSPYQEEHDIGNSCRKLCLITSQPLEIFDENGRIEMNLTIGDQQLDIGTKMKLVDCGKMETWEEGNLETAMKFTERLLRTQLHTPFKGNLKEVKWLLVPLKQEFQHQTENDKGEKKGKNKRKLQRRDISWDEIEDISEGPLWKSPNMENKEALRKQCKDAMITVTSAEFSKRKYINSIRTDLTLSSPHPKISGKTIQEVLSINVRPFDFFDQPILELEDVITSDHGGIITSIIHPSKAEITYSLAGMVDIHCLPSSIFKTSSILPYFFHELDTLLVASELNTAEFQDSIDLKLLGQALTPPNVDSNLSKNYERLEFMGDTILKFVTTINAYIQIQNIIAKGNDNDKVQKEKIDNILMDRQIVLTNRSLQTYSIKSKLNLYMRTKRLKSKDWLPLDWDINWNDPNLKGNVSDTKVIADVLEAIIAASYLTSRDLDQVILVMQTLGIPLKNLTKWEDLKFFIPPCKSIIKDDNRIQVEEKYMRFFKLKQNAVLGYEFNDKEIMNTVLSLGTDQERKSAYERYKFLGNALLDFLVVEYLYDRFPDEGPAALHHLKIARCSEATRFALCAEYGLLDLITVTNDSTKLQITKIRKTLKSAKANADQLRNNISSGKVGTKNEDSGMEWWDDVTIPHSSISDPIEALFGGILYDSSFSFKPILKILKEKFIPFWEKYCKISSFSSSNFNKINKINKNSKQELLEWLQFKGCKKCLIEIKKSTNIHLNNNNNNNDKEKKLNNKLNDEQQEEKEKEKEKEEIIIYYHDKIIISKFINSNDESSKKVIKDLCKFTLNFLKDKNGFENLCDCQSRK